MNAIPSVELKGRGGPCSRSGHRWRHFSKSGFTILEVALASFVMIYGIVTALTVLQASFRQIDSARYTTLAGQILQSQMEKLRLLNWAQLTDPTTGAVAFPTFTPDLAVASTAQLSHFTSCTQTIVDAPSPFTGTMKDITLTVTWYGSDGHQQSLSYYTRYGQNGLSDFFYTTH